MNIDFDLPPISKKSVKEFKQIYEKEFNRKLSEGEATELANDFFKLIIKAAIHTPKNMCTIRKSHKK